MTDTTEEIAGFLESVHPYDNLLTDERARIARKMVLHTYQPDEIIYRIDDPLGGVFVIMSGEVETTDRNGAMVSLLTARNTFGERGFLRDGNAATTARATQQSHILQLPAAEFRRLLKTFISFQRYFNRAQRQPNRAVDIATQKVAELIARAPLYCAPSTTASQAAQMMREHHVSSLGIVDPDSGLLLGIITVRDLANRVVAGALDPSIPVRTIMTRDPVTLPLSALGSDVLHQMLEHKVGHLPIVERGQLMGM
ncbi:MAG: histidine kinase, partial [Rhodobacterales bacterium 34-62-10]